jgi:hypothetical protein
VGPSPSSSRAPANRLGRRTARQWARRVVHTHHIRRWGSRGPRPVRAGNTTLPVAPSIEAPPPARMGQSVTMGTRAPHGLVRGPAVPVPFQVPAHVSRATEPRGAPKPAGRPSGPPSAPSTRVRADVSRATGGNGRGNPGSRAAPPTGRPRPRSIGRVRHGRFHRPSADLERRPTIAPHAARRENPSRPAPPRKRAHASAVAHLELLGEDLLMVLVSTIGPPNRPLSPHRTTPAVHVSPR